MLKAAILTLLSCHGETLWGPAERAQMAQRHGFHPWKPLSDSAQGQVSPSILSTEKPCFLEEEQTGSFSNALGTGRDSV